MSWLSYLTPLSVYRGKSKRNTKIEVREIFGQRKLDLDGYPQTGPRFRRSWKNIFEQSSMDDLPSHAKILVLGLGGGDVIRLLTNYRANVRIKVVELEQEVIDVAEKYFGISSSKRIAIACNDAKEFVQNNKRKYDLVIVDLYSGDDVPQFVTEDSFLINISQALKLKGRVIFNFASQRFGEQEFVSFEKSLKKFFAQVTPLKAGRHPFYLVFKKG